MIKKLEQGAAVELFNRVYKDSPKRILLIDDGSPSGWKESDTFPKIGECELLINDIQIPVNLISLISLLHTYYANKEDGTFFFLQEEYSRASEIIYVECDLASLDEIVKFVDDVPNLNALLFDASFSWALRFHHESFGYFSGDKSICNLLRSSDLANLIRDPVWI